VKVLDGRAVPLFPLPNLVLYPRIVQPLHVFEPRYRTMLADVLNSYGKIAVALLKPGYESEYQGSPEIWPTVGVGTVVTYDTRDDGTSDVVLLGECRAKVLEEVGGKEYRQATLVRLEPAVPATIAGRDRLRSTLEGWLRVLTRDLGEEQRERVDQLQAAFAKEDDVGFLVDFLTFHFIEDLVSRQSLLEELDVERRAALLTAALEAR